MAYIMSRNVPKRYRMMQNVSSGKVIKIRKIVICYRYKDNFDDLAELSVFGYSVNRTTPLTLCYGMELESSTCGANKYMVKIIELNNYEQALYFDICLSHYESLRDVLYISSVHDIGEIPGGDTPGSDTINCGLYIYAFAINNGDIFSFSNEVTLDNSVSGGTPTHYMVSRYEDFRDAEWLPYSVNPTVLLYIIGINGFYFKVKDADGNESNIVYDDIGWHGALWKFYSDQASLSVPELSFDSDLAGSVIGSIHLPEPYSESAQLELPELSATDSLLITLT